jgi:RNA polymerase sigma-70 factor (ECF subfamily)
VGLLERFAAGDVDAFEELFREFQGQVYGWILLIVRNQAAAEDLTVEAFWRIHRARARFDATRSFGAWARRIATNVALDHLRSAPPEVPLEENLADRATQAAAEREDLAQALRRAFSQLPPKLRAVASLVLVEQESYADAAEALGISIGALKSREFRAVRLLRKKLKRMGFEP